MPRRADPEKSQRDLHGRPRPLAGRRSRTRTLSYAREIRTTLEAAAAADPRNPNARFALRQFHEQAPRVAGGSPAEADPLALDPYGEVAEQAWARCAAGEGQCSRSTP